MIPAPPRDAGHRATFAVTVKGTAAARLMRSVRDDLGLARRQQIEAALADWGTGRQRWSYAGRSCCVEGCDEHASTRGLCVRHFDRWYKATAHGRPTDIVPRPLSPADAAQPARPPCRASPDCSLQWLAGPLEGEGSFGVTTTAGHAYPLITLQMCDESVVRRAAALVGAPSVIRREPDRESWRATFSARVAGRAAAVWMERLRPLMAARRSAAIAAALDAYRPVRLVAVPPGCVVPGCARAHRSRGLCHAHYMSWMRDVRRGRQPRVTPLR